MLQVLQARAKANRRTLSEQLKYYTYLGMVAADNPDLPLSKEFWKRAKSSRPDSESPTNGACSADRWPTRVVR